LKDSCLEGKLDQIDLKRVGVIIGTGTGGIATFEEQCRNYIEKGPSRVSPFFVPMFMPNVAAGLVSMRYTGSKGPNLRHRVGVRHERTLAGRRLPVDPTRRSGRSWSPAAPRRRSRRSPSRSFRQHEGAVGAQTTTRRPPAVRSTRIATAS